MAEEHTPLQGCMAASVENRSVPHKWLYHLDARAGNVLAGFGEFRLSGFFLVPQLEHGETCSTADATRGHHAFVHAVVCCMKLADLGIATEPRGLTASQARPTLIF